MALSLILQVFYPLKAMPLTPNGKIDKTKLPFPDTATMLLNRTHKEVTDELSQMQKLLMGIWEGVLGLIIMMQTQD